MAKAEPIKLGFLIDYIGESSSMDDLSNFSLRWNWCSDGGRSRG